MSAIMLRSSKKFNGLLLFLEHGEMANHVGTMTLRPADPLTEIFAVFWDLND